MDKREGPANHKSAFFFLKFKFWGGVLGRGGGGGWGFFSFFLCPQYVPFKFSMGSHQVFNVFPKGFPIAPHFNPICFAQSPPLLTHIGGPN